jgi:hypothetical protein
MTFHGHTEFRITLPTGSTAPDDDERGADSATKR